MKAVKELFSKDSTSTTGTTGNVAHNTRSSNLDAGDSRDYPSGNVSNTSGTTGTAGSTLGSRSSGQYDTDRTSVGTGSLGKHAHNLEPEHATHVGSNATDDHQHLAPVTKETTHKHEVEEVTRTREHDRHVHHVASHVQPVKDETHTKAVHHHNQQPVQEIHEQHASTDADRKAFAGLHIHENEVNRGIHDKQIIDKGEIVNENVHHHVHHVVQPIIERDVHAHHVHHTTIPVHQVTHEAPILHQVQNHEPMLMKDFVSGGGDLKSNLTAHNAGVLADGSCERDLGDSALSGNKHGHAHGHTGHTGQHNLGTTGTTGQHNLGTTGSTGTTGGIGAGATGQQQTGQHNVGIAAGRASGNSGLGTEGYETTSAR